MKSFIIASAIYSKFPIPQMDWEKKALSWAPCWFPLVGLAVGMVLRLQLAPAGWLGFGAVFTATLALLLPIVFSGGIHLDGFCDIYDAPSFHQSREQRLEILKDSHTEAFAIICCGLYLLVFFVVWCEAAPARGAILVLALGPVFSRGLSDLFAVTLPNAQGTGLLATSTDPMSVVKARGVLVAWTILTGGATVAADVRTGLVVLTGVGLACVYHVVIARRQFGGVTSDLARSSLRPCELGMVLCAMVGQRLEVLLWF